MQSDNHPDAQLDNDKPSERKVEGLVYTFYSYKGGVGRSMALANVGVTLAMESSRVLLVDWDLEAPGLESYFSGRITSALNPAGVIDILEGQTNGSPVNWQSCIQKVEFLGCSLDLISAGHRNDNYQKRVQSLDWNSLYSQYGIGNFINRLREEWREAYDFVLIDSRTGISDIGDICTVLLPDILVLLFVTNQQNLDGILNAFTRARKAHSALPVDRDRLLAVPVLSRDERHTESDRSLAWVKKSADTLSFMYEEWLPRGLTAADALNKLFIPYIPYWSFGERLPVLEQERERADPTSIGAAFSRLSSLLANRLDWYASVEGHASESEVLGARQELLAAREALKDLEELRQTEAARLRRRAIVWISIVTITAIIFVGIILLKPPTIADLAIRLQSSRHEERAAAVNELLNYKGDARAYMNDALRLLSDPDAEIRAQAVTALTSMGVSADRYQDAYEVLLRDTAPAVRRAALRAVSLLGKDGERFAPSVAQLLSDGDDATRAAATEALGSLGTISSIFSSDVLRLLNDENGAVRSAAAKTVGMFNGAGIEHFAAVAALRSDEDPAVRSAAAETLAKMGLAPELASFLKDRDPIIRGGAVRSLANLGASGRQFAPQVAALLADISPSVRARAIEALANMGQDGAEYRSAIAARVADPAWQVRFRAVSALGTIPTSRTRLVSELSRALEDENGLVRSEAERVLRTGPSSAASVPE